MCGIFGIATPAGRRVSLGSDAIERLRDVLAHRGPDGAGTWRTSESEIASDGQVVLAHRRLKVVDLSDAAGQPMSSGPSRAISYNGELYNDAELRRELESTGTRFTTRSDTETVLRALEAWGAGALARLRGMFAIAYLDGPMLTLARDPLGIKPLYYALARVGDGVELVFASEPAPILAHPAIARRPDPVVLSAYLTTLRTVLEDRTLFAGVRVVRPGEALEFDLRDPTLTPRGRPIAAWPASRFDGAGGAVAACRSAVEDSVERHRRSDVPVACLLSGGLDSTIIASVARRRPPEIRTYAAGAGVDPDSDLAHARSASEFFGTRHTEVVVDEGTFLGSWREMIGRQAAPLCTPNEVAIRAIAGAVRRDGVVVVLSGEGADELFGGYGLFLDAARAFESRADEAGLLGEARWRAAARHGLDQSAWVPRASKPAIVSREFWRAAEADTHLAASSEALYERAARGQDRGLETHLRALRGPQLAGLLQRLDSATMRESIEGRTPLADVELAALADGLPMELVHDPALPPAIATKRALRLAFEDQIPRAALERPKASFPLPFQRWISGVADEVRGSAWARDAINPEALRGVLERPAELWTLAWPIFNLSLWSRRWLE